MPGSRAAGRTAGVSQRHRAGTSTPFERAPPSIRCRGQSQGIRPLDSRDRQGPRARADRGNVSAGRGSACASAPRSRRHPRTPGAENRAVIRDAEVLIVGAGPTGLVLALWLTRLGVRVRIVDKTAQPGHDVARTGRAGPHARVLSSDRTGRRRRRARPANGRAICGWPAAAWRARCSATWARASARTPTSFIFPQDEHERLLIDRLERRRRQGRARDRIPRIRGDADRVVARLRRAGAAATDSCEAAFVAGCDGAHSVSVQALGDRISRRHVRASLLRRRRRGARPGR